MAHDFYARVVAGVVAEIVPGDGAVPLADRYHPDLIPQFVGCGADVEPGWTYDGTTFADPADAVVPPPTKAELIAYAADRRWRAETGGIVVAGATIDTDRASQAMITGAYAWSQAHPEQTVAFKARGGFVTLDAAAVEAIASAVGSHVQECFAVEATVDAVIDAETITDFAGVDAADWPG